MAGQLDETIQLLEQVHALDAQNVGRADALGRAFELTPAVPMISRTIDFFRQIPISTLHELGEGQRSLIYNLAQDFLSFYGRMMTFDPAASNNAAADRAALIDQATSNYNNIFANLFPIVAYLRARNLDPNEASREARETLAELKRLSSEGVSAVAAVEAEASRVLAEVRRTAAESGVSQQAVYFDTEANTHKTLASKWQE